MDILVSAGEDCLLSGLDFTSSSSSSSIPGGRDVGSGGGWSPDVAERGLPLKKILTSLRWTGC